MLRSGYEPGRPELVLDVARDRAGDLGVSAKTIAMTNRILIAGVEAGTYEQSGSRYDITVKLREADRSSVDQMSQLQIRSRAGNLVDLPSVVDTTYTEGPARIERQDRARKVSLFANAGSGTALGDAAAIVQSVLKTVAQPPGTSILFEGQVRRMRESAEAITGAFILAILALYIVLASQFNSFGQPLVIMLSAPLCFSGAFAGLYLAGQEMSLFAQIGLIALMGIVMKNGILLVDRANQLRDSGMSAIDAMVVAGPERLRPVLMTAFAAIFWHDSSRAFLGRWIGVAKRDGLFDYRWAHFIYAFDIDCCSCCLHCWSRYTLSINQTAEELTRPENQILEFTGSGRMKPCSSKPHRR
jgi:HAE1 family hydrophobic/amphiphilic exporter-1